MPSMGLALVELVRNVLNENMIVLLNVSLALIAVVATLRSTWATLYGYVETLCLTTVYIKEDDNLYDDVILWMNDHIFQQQHFRSVIATTSNQAEHNYNTKGCTAAATRNKQASLGPHVKPTTLSIQFRPFQGSRLFKFHHKWILFSHSAAGADVNHAPVQREDNLPLKLQCLSLSLGTLHTFLAEAARYSRKVSMSNVSIYRALSNACDIIRWGRITSRPSRDLSTVILDRVKKETILRDISEYLHPHTKQWYANHGIPYRRGYLFSGPPGTGKTSLASAIAGAFGLDIYVLSLLDANMTESQVIRLFSEVPSQCVVLLEDIDVAGVSMRRDIPREARTDNGRPGNRLEPSGSSTISLSGLLNAIDGISSHEGRILIMTTNAPQILDRALIRPGRVDLHIQFELPSREELRGLFLSMFSDITGVGPRETDDKSEGIAVEELAEQFACKVPERQLSLAEVQGFLLQYKKRPAEACAQISDWITEIQDEDEDEDEGSIL
ncbi:hypothetical protein FE257_007137 [Aspergillus nanangensis]|uniref:P-loop containing nucleoside triphosphate hydrolase protein n=1 Tax=Aspergillus nanangensis TaxID=2582783 RepID=A0AAD4CN66_ASPNN|nr:hypothetical protein FE257_007137 [Aspergillus nanangensis]